MENCQYKTPLTLEISANPFTTLQGFFENFPSEKFQIGELNSYDNAIPEAEIGQLISLAKASPILKTLRLSSPTKKEKIPEVFLFEEDCLQKAQVSCPQGGVETLLFSGFLFLSLNLNQSFDFLSSLKSLTVRNSGMGDQYLLQTLPQLLNCVPSLEHLDLGENHLTDFSLWASLASPTRLKKICLLGNSISLENPVPQQALTGWDHLLQLDLNCNKLTLEGFSQLADILIDGLDGMHIASDLLVLEVSGHCTDADQDDWLAQAVALQNARPKLKVYFK
ncbi:hypothetical protein DSO57_1037856 [Entomophthora muscae]|uniref:Uncharacterized protein n=1 Tax=Entomophthora muscae TaxID=34485 RepID=A0ACC2TL88_9FUNG|nr:hypothetical protein DSO57_1037856 [Entomophthora muscae]